MIFGVPDILGMLFNVFDYNQFKYNGKIHKQLYDTLMGLPLIMFMILLESSNICNWPYDHHS